MEDRVGGSGEWRVCYGGGGVRGWGLSGGVDGTGTVGGREVSDWVWKGLGERSND